MQLLCVVCTPALVHLRGLQDIEIAVLETGLQFCTKHLEEKAVLEAGVPVRGCACGTQCKTIGLWLGFYHAACWFKGGRAVM